MDSMDFARLVKEKRERDQQKLEGFQGSSKQRLQRIIAQKIRTTMIGALEALENQFSFLWSTGESPEELLLKERYEKARSRILGIGNDQIRNLGTELEQYTIEWNRYQYEIPVKPKGEGNVQTEEG